jgi:putative CGCGG family rSAM target protein
MTRSEPSDAEALRDEPPHDGSWSANLERERHAESEARVVEDALAAVEATAPGFHVNLVTHGDHGDPRDYLWDAVESTEREQTVEYVDRCGCGGYVTRVHVHDA